MKGSGRALQHQLAIAAWRRAQAGGSEEATELALAAIAAALKASSRLRQVLLHPGVDRDRKVALVGSVVTMDAVAESVLRAAIGLRAVAVLGGVSREYAGLRASRAKEARVIVWTADRLDRNETATLKAELETALSRPVRLEIARKKNLIGGLLVRIGEKTVDGTVKGALERLERKLLEESSGRGKN
jgi:F-type H+-transporting ATPase subunit delta